MLRHQRAGAGLKKFLRFVNIGDAVFGDYLGTGWREAANACRRMDGVGTLRIAPPRDSRESLVSRNL